jgi:hypothetical protein
MESNNNIKDIIRSKLSKILHGQMKFPCTFGYIDIITDNKIIHIENALEYIVGYQKILAYSLDYPNKTKMVHLFYHDENILNDIIEKAKKLYDTFDILLTFELVQPISDYELVQPISDISDNELIHPNQFYDKFEEYSLLQGYSYLNKYGITKDNWIYLW